MWKEWYICIYVLHLLLLRCSLLRRFLLRCSLLGCSLLGRCLLGCSLLRQGLLRRGLLRRGLLRRGLLRCSLLGRGSLLTCLLRCLLREAMFLEGMVTSATLQVPCLATRVLHAPLGSTEEASTASWVGHACLVCLAGGTAGGKVLGFAALLEECHVVMLLEPGPATRILLAALHSRRHAT